ncbi:hypothetical protein C0995_010791 [Termitomyces sp. Mi166|nr:hypothetical protein C0995_010791 [Termitomyces sp. Mi166\
MASGEPRLVSNDVSSFLAILFSFSALKDWLKLFVIGGIFESLRRFLMTGYNKFLNSFFIRASFDNMDPSYEWILVWLSRQPSWSKTRDMHITTRVSGGNSPAIVLEGEEDHSHNPYFKSSRKIAYLPSASMTYSLWFKKRWVTITRLQRTTHSSGIYGDKEDTLHIRRVQIFCKKLADSTWLVRNIACVSSSPIGASAVKPFSLQFIANIENSSSNHWNHVACRAKRSLNSIVLDPGVKDVLLEDARDFLQSKSWYAERGIPFRRGYLLYGVPGSGKTSMIHCMAGELRLDVYIISLSRTGLDDASLNELVNALPERCIALMEDIDAAFTHSVSRSDMTESDDDEKEDAKKSSQKQPPGAAPPPTPSRLSLSGLLNALDGVGAQEGRILFATTNRYSALDQALCRPGRMDLHIEFKNASKYQARELFSRFYFPTPTEAQDDEKHESRGQVSNDSDSCNEKPISKAPVVDLSLFTGQIHPGRTPILGLARIAELAERFADAIPERECSVASLQGYLMSYKTRPVEAVEGVAEWVEKERTRRQEQEKKKEEAEEADKLKKSKERKAEDTPTPLMPCACHKVPTCATCGGVKVEDSIVALPSPISKSASPHNEASA